MSRADLVAAREIEYRLRAEYEALLAESRTIEGRLGALRVALSLAMAASTAAHESYIGEAVDDAKEAIPSPAFIEALRDVPIEPLPVNNRP